MKSKLKLSMKNKHWNIGDWVLCTNLEPPQEATVFAHHPEGEFVTVKTEEGKEYSYPEASHKLAIIEEVEEYHINPEEISDIDTFFLHLMSSPDYISSFMVKSKASRGMNMASLEAKKSTCYYLSLAPKQILDTRWSNHARTLAGICNTLFPMIQASTRGSVNTLTRIKRSGTLN